jgi:flagellar hook-associated protein 3 FlgL
MRVTESMAMRDFLRDTNGARSGMLEAQNKVSTGRSVLRPSDNPRDLSDILRLRADKVENAQYERNVEYGRSRLDFADTALASIQDMVERVRFLGLTAISTDTQTDAFSTEVEGLRSQILGTANSALQGRFVFGGSDGETLPFSEDPITGVVTYQGNSDQMKVQVGRASTLQTQLPGDDLFGSGNDVFQSLTDLIVALKTGDKSQIDAKLKPLESAWEGISLSRSRVGSQINVADSIAREMSAMSLVRESNLVDLESADLTTALTEFQSYQNAVQSTLAVGARISQLTLLDYI